MHGPEDLRALVTGASSGIGAAFARQLRQRGERLVLVARRADRLTALAAELGGPPAVQTLALDLTLSDGPARLESELAQRGLAIDLLVNNAGVGHTGCFAEEPLPRIMEMIDLNARSLVELTRRLLPGMVARRRGRIVNVVSTGAFQPLPYMAVYGATKAFVLSYTEALATELAGTGIVVQALCPGLTHTEFQQVAGTDRVLFNKTAAMSPDAVATASLAALDRRRLRVVVGRHNRLTVFAQHFVPQSLVRFVAARLFKPR